MPILFLLASIGMVVNAFITDPRNTGITFGIIGLGIPAYFAWRAWAGRDGGVPAADTGGS